MTVLIAEKYFKPTANEYTTNLADAYMRNGFAVIVDDQNLVFSNFTPDILHLQWPEALYKWHKYVDADDNGIHVLETRLTQLKDDGCIILYTVHNLVPNHANDDIDKKMYESIMSFVDIFIHHGKESIKLLIESYPFVRNSKHIIAPHGEYKKQPNIPYQQARETFRLPVAKYVITNFGQIRKNKGEEFFVTISKKFNHKYIFFRIGNGMIHSSKISKKIGKTLYLLNKYIFNRSYWCMKKSINNSDIPKIMYASDIIFLAHTSGLNTGIIPHAITYGKPVVFPRIGNFLEQVSGWDWFETYEVGNVESAILAIDKLISRLKKKKPGMISFCNNEWLSKNSWDNHISIISNVINNFNSESIKL